MRRSAPAEAQRQFLKALELAPSRADVGGRATIALGDLHFRAKRYERARKLFAGYIGTFPQGDGIGTAFLRLATVEYAGMNDPAGARKTLKAFLSKFPDDAQGARAAEMLEQVERAIKKGQKK
ncbi:hypothetical protein LCGC14_2218600 [marine sediment metagenome]|uniref:Uncharacterized protein n=1 Tax=marine sediment metagenome TaxID=412755 RepID=A0A0F9DBM7_9ZZZZ